MKLTVCMFYDDNLKIYADYSRKINKIYCKKYGYKFIYSSDKKLDNMTPHYERYKLLLDNIDDCDWIMWIDSDAYFYEDSPPLDYLIYNYHNDKNEYESILSYSKLNILSENYKSYDINNGVFLFKNCENSKKILNRILNSNDIKEVAEKLHVIYDQAIFRYLYDNNYSNFKDKSCLLKYGILQHFFDFELNRFIRNKPYIHHLAMNNEDKRKKIIKNYYYKKKYFNWTNILLFTTSCLFSGYFFYKYFR